MKNKPLRLRIVDAFITWRNARRLKAFTNAMLRGIEKTHGVKRGTYSKPLAKYK